MRYEAANAGLDGLTLIMQLALEQANEHDQLRDAD
jgi:hypothetical protein